MSKRGPKLPSPDRGRGVAVTARARPPRYAGIAAELAELRERVRLAVAALDEAPDVGTEPSRKQAAAVAQANVRAWIILTDGRDPPSRYAESQDEAAKLDLSDPV